MSRRLILTVLLLSSTGCWATQEQLLNRASFDLECPISKLRVTEIDSRTRGVKGCGDQAVYIESCDGQNRTNCTWVMNTAR
jgi:hypothetical protein